ncbi:MAG: PTS transporter subunit EIIB [Bacillota bacterium]
MAYEDMARVITDNIGGKENILNAEICATRIRFSLKDLELVNDVKLKDAGCLGVLRYGKVGVQLIVGKYAENVLSEIIN